jgi:hypothetical protein
MALTTTSESQNMSDDILICDSGACGHYFNFKERLFNIKEISEHITIGNGRAMSSTFVWSANYKVIQLNGNSLHVTLHKVKYASELWVNLFSLRNNLKSGYTLSNKGVSIFLLKGDISVTFKYWHNLPLCFWN